MTVFGVFDHVCSSLRESELTDPNAQTPLKSPTTIFSNVRGFLRPLFRCPDSTGTPAGRSVETICSLETAGTKLG